MPWSQDQVVGGRPTKGVEGEPTLGTGAPGHQLRAVVADQVLHREHERAGARREGRSLPADAGAAAPGVVGVEHEQAYGRGRVVAPLHRDHLLLLRIGIEVRIDDGDRAVGAVEGRDDGGQPGALVGRSRRRHRRGAGHDGDHEPRVRRACFGWRAAGEEERPERAEGEG